jgi:hypothetical protein
MSGVDVLAASLAGRCTSGEERGAGRLIHAVPAEQGMRLSGYLDIVGSALCGAKPGRRSVGWSPSDRSVSCPRCIKRVGGAA